MTITCRKCRLYPSNCGYWELNGKRDKGGNTITLNPDMKHNCPDFERGLK